MPSKNMNSPAWFSHHQGDFMTKVISRNPPMHNFTEEGKTLTDP